MTDLTQPTEMVHKAYCAMTGLYVPLTMARMCTWHAWLCRGWTIDHLRLVVNFISHKLSEPARTNSLRFSRLIEDMDRFEEDLAEAQARARVPRIDAGRAQVLRATGRVVERPTSEPKSAEAILRANQALAELLKVRDNL